MSKTFKQYMEHPMSTLTLIVLITGTITGWQQLSGSWNASHTTQAELDAVSVPQKCESIAIRISLAEQAIWQMKQAKQETQRLVDKRRELKNLNSKFDDLHCASIIS